MEARVKQINLSNVLACVDELQTCANSLAILDHWFNASVDMLSDAEETWSAYESTAAAEVRPNLPKTATATEVRAAMNEWVRNRPDARKAWDHLREARKYKEKVERFIRTLEKRGGLAQSAKNGHESLAQHAGSANPDRQYPRAA